MAAVKAKQAIASAISAFIPRPYVSPRGMGKPTNNRSRP